MNKEKPFGYSPRKWWVGSVQRLSWFGVGILGLDAFGLLYLLVLLSNLRPACLAGGENYILCFPSVSVLLVLFGNRRLHARAVEKELGVQVHFVML